MDPAAQVTLSDGLPVPAVAPDVAGVATLLRWVANRPLRVRLTREQLQTGYCTRSPRQALAENTLGYSTPCADLSAITAVALTRLGLPPTLVLGGIRRLHAVKFQCGLELELEGRTWVIGFGEASTYFYAGRFLETRRRPLVLRASAEALDPDRPFLAWFHAQGRGGLPELVPGYDLARDLRSHAWRQTWLHYALARRKARDPARAQKAGRVSGASGRWSY